MKIIVCLDDYGGMLFNFRRQSRDRVLVEDVIASLGDKKLYISEYSKILFEAHEGKYEIIDDFFIRRGLFSGVQFVTHRITSFVVIRIALQSNYTDPCSTRRQALRFAMPSAWRRFQTGSRSARFPPRLAKTIPSRRNRASRR